MENAQKNKIMDAACALYKQKRSCKNVTMDEVAAYCGISKRTLYECFNNKEQLLYESMNRIVDCVLRECEQFRLVTKHSFEMFFGSLRIVHKYFKDIYGLALEMRTNYPEVFKKFISSHMVFAKTNMMCFFEQAKKEGFIYEHIDEHFFISVLEMNMYYSSKIAFLRANAKFGEEKIRFMVLYVVLRGVSTVKGVEYIDDALAKQKTE